MNRVVQIAINAIALWVAVWLLRPGIQFTGVWWKLVLVAIVFSLVNTYVRPILRILTLPISVLTLGIFLLVINAVMLLLVSAVSSQLNLDFHVANFGAAFIGAIVISVVGFLVAVAITPARTAGRLF
jgi:putative membrane protein